MISSSLKNIFLVNNNCFSNLEDSVRNYRANIKNVKLHSKSILKLIANNWVIIAKEITHFPSELILLPLHLHL